MKTISDYAYKASEEMAIKIERYLRLCIRPKPWWMPKMVWEIILKRLLVLEELRDSPESY